MDEEWQILASMLPEGWEGLAGPTGAMQRARGAIKSAETLLKLLLLHIATGLSLKQTVVRAKLQGIADISDVALLKRLRSSDRWLRELSLRMFHDGRFARSVVMVPSGCHLRAIDATTIEEPGATGTSWRVHYSLNMSNLACDYYELSDARGGESFRRFPVNQGDIILADRGYCHREGVAHVVQNGGNVIVRLNSTSFPLLSRENGAPFQLLSHLRQLKGSRPKEWDVNFKAGGKMINARLCALRKGAIATEKAQKRAKKVAKKNTKILRPETLECAGYVYVLTTIDNRVMTTKQILDLYRARWQIELCFKRMKSLFRLGHLPKRNDDSARAWIQGKLLTVLLIEKMIDQARFFSPWGYAITSKESMAGIH